MGSGKSTIGKALARHLDRPFIDTDHRIEKALKVEIRDIFAKQGEAWFRIYEEKVIEEVIATEKKAVISLGGGTLLSQKTTDQILANGILIYIKSEPEEIWKRIRHSTRRPLLQKEGKTLEKEEYLARMDSLMKARLKGYESAHLLIDRDGKETKEITTEILEKLENLDLTG
jgi:shikimate kinase